MRGGQVQTAATMAQKVAISLAYFGLTGMLGYLYWLSHEETISMLPAKHKTQAMKYHHTVPDEEAFKEEDNAGEYGEQPGVSDK